jgi:NAD(P)-dependent dehydrogenase (short-subunit alcohol dehydrogenase family)
MSESKVVVVTGVSSGIGRVTALMFAQQGFRVFGTVRDVERALLLPGVELIAMDIQQELSVQHGIQSVIDQAGRIDVLVNNAGTTLVGSIEETSMDEAKALFDTNLFGMLRTIQAVLPQMRAQGHGRIVNVSSVLGFLPAPYMGLYSASKHAVEGLSESLDHEIRQFGIRVSLVEPSFTKTNLDLNAPVVVQQIPAYEHERALSSRALVKNVQAAPVPDSVAACIFKAATGKWRMRYTPSGEATQLSMLRRFMLSGPVSAGIRKTFGLS